MPRRGVLRWLLHGSEYPTFTFATPVTKRVASCGTGEESARGRSNFRGQGHRYIRVHGYQNARFDELAERQLTATEPDERRQIVNEMPVILAQDAPMLSLSYPADLWIYRAGPDTVDEWCFASGWSGGGTNGACKHLFVTGQDVGTEIAQ